MKKINSIIWKQLSILGILVVNIFGYTHADSPSQSSRVYLTGTKLTVEKRKEDGSLKKPAIYTIKGVTWSPATHAPAKGTNPLNSAETIDYGFFFDWPGRNPQGNEIFNYWQKKQFQQHFTTDIPLMKEMNVNTVRAYADFSEDMAVSKSILDEFYRNNIMVIMTVAISKAEIENERYLEIVKKYKDHPAILMWSLGNEWNLNRYYCYSDDCPMDNLIEITNLAAGKIKEIDSFHPVSSCLGDRFDTFYYNAGGPCSGPPETHSDIPWIVKNIPNVDIWGINAYRGTSFGNLFNQWKEVWGQNPKPFYLSEFGTDSFWSYAYHTPYQCSILAKVDDGREDQDEQKNVFFFLWNEITNNISSLYDNALCLGGLVHEFNDELWKIGSFHVGLGDPFPEKKFINYDGADNIPGTEDDDTSFDEYNSQGFLLKGSHRDDVSNEEYFGVVNADRNPKKIFFEIQRSFNSPPAALIGEITPKNERETIELNGSLSYDPEEKPFSFLWKQTAGKEVALTGVNTAILSFIAPEVPPQEKQIILTFQLTVNDGMQNSAPANVDVIIKDIPRQPVIIEANTDRKETNINEPVIFCGKASDPDNNIDYVQWIFGDGEKFTANSTSEICNHTHLYKTSGIYQAAFKVKDTTNQEAMSEFITVVVNPLQFSPPHIGFILPSGGIPGTTIRIYGNNFGEQSLPSRIQFLGIEEADAQIISWSNSYIVCKVPKLKPAAYKITVINQNAESNSKNFVIPQPHIGFMLPSGGIPSTTIRIYGNNFGEQSLPSRIQFLGIEEADAQIISWSNSYIVCKVPKLKPAAYKITVINQNAESNSKNFVIPQPHIGFMLPSGGIPGTTIRIYGNNFGEQSSLSRIQFLGIEEADAQIISWSNTYIVCKVPKLKPAAYKITVINQNAESNSKNFVIPQPHIGFMLPSGGIASTTIRIYGNNFGEQSLSSRIQFLGAEKADAQIVNWSNTYIVCKIPKLKPAAYKITVINQNAESNAKDFVIKP